MKILLVGLDSKYAHSNLALKYLYTAAGTRASIDIKEFTINQDADYMFMEILAGDYDVICFSCYIWNVEAMVYLAENIKKATPESVIVFGGPEVSYDTAEFMIKNKAVDFVVMGEGEYTFGCLIRALASDAGGYDKIRGLARRKGGKVFINPAAELPVFDSIPFPYHALPPEKDKVAYYESARGCPFNCTYCISSLEKKTRVLPLERVREDIDYFIEKEVKQVKFIDRTFNFDRERCKEILRHTIAGDNGVINFHFEICGELIDDAFIESIRTARKGLLQFEVGIQSTNPKTLEAVDRSAATEELLRGVGKLTALDNVDTHVDLIAGLPFESYDLFKKSFNDAYGLSADEFHLGFLKLLRGTKIREDADLYGYEFRSKAPYEVISNKFLSAKDVCGLKQIAETLKLYYNRGGFEKTLKYAVNTFAETPFDFYEEFSIFYNLKGFQHKPRKKEDLYRILLAYAEWKSKKIDVSKDEIRPFLEEDMKNALNPDAIKKFERKGWNIW